MEHTDNIDKRPTKKARLDLPDGFAKTSSSAKKVAPIKFVSAFETRSSARQAKPVAKVGVPHAKVPPPRPDGPSRDTDRGSTPAKPPVLRVLKPPPLPLPKPANPKSTPKKLTSLMSMPPPTLPPPKPADTRLISITSLKPLPVTPPPPNKKLKPLGSLVPPPIPGPSRRPASEMKTIFTTNVALATDIRTERGQAEVLALYLQQYGTGFVDPTERELQRGLETSPEKLSKRTKHAKFARGGLADRARSLLKQRQTGLSLWQISLELELKAKRRPRPDMRLRVISILYAATDAHHVRTAHPPCLACLRCAIMPEFRQEEVLLILNFDAASGASPIRFHKMTDLKVGREIFLWKPWQTLDIPASSAELLARLDVGEGGALASGEAGDAQAAMLCTRFWLAPF